MRRFVLMLSCILLVFMLSPVNGFALQYRYEDWDYEFDDTNYWINGWCYRPFDESEKTAILVAYDPNIIKGDVLVIPESINGYKINGFSHGLFQRSTFKSCDLSSFPNLAKRMFDESSLEHVILSKETKKIPDGCFLDCPLETIELHEGIETIESYAFRGTKLKELVIPSTVKEMGFQVISYCPELKKIEFKNGALTEINENSLSLGSTFMVENLETLIIPENITQIGKNEFKVAEAGRHGFNFIKYPDNLTIYGKKGSYAEAYAAEHELSFVAVESENSTSNEEKVNFESKYDISQFMDSSIYKIYDVFDTDYGAVVYYSMGGFMGAPGPGLSLVRENGEVVNLSIGVSKEDLYRRPEHNDIKLSEDGKYVTFNVSFGERAEGTEGVLGGNLVVYHDAGTYYYKSSLEDGTCIETKFEPLDTISEEIISAWAKTEVENAIELGFVPIMLRENYKRNITRAEFAQMAIYFLSVQYGYQPEHILRTYYNMDRDFPLQDFLSAYCSEKKDRNGNDFINAKTGEARKYEEKRSGDILLQYDDTIFTDLNNENLFENTLINIAYNIGIVNGVSENNFNPDGNITRQEAAAMLMRVYRNYAEFDDENNEFEFSDDEDISDWAKEDVYSINALGVMQGVGEDVFAPEEGYTVEQAIATFLRLYESAPVSRKNKNIAPLLENEKEIYFIDIPGLSTFTVESEDEYEEYTVIAGTHWNRHGKGDNKVYVFYSYGGMRDLLSFIPRAQENNYEIEEMEVNSNENVIKFNANVSDTFRLYNKLNGSEKVYGIGKYRFEIDLVTGNIISLIRIS